MNEKALYQLERAVDALKLMAEALREEQFAEKNISINTGDVVFPTAWNDDVISFGDIEINTGTEGNITFS